MSKIDLACLIEDNPASIFWMETVIEDVQFCDKLLIYHHGKQALDGLTEIIMQGGKLPEIIFLDLNMPVMDGWEFLEEFGAIAIEQVITIYIVTSSINPQDQKRAERHERVTNFIVKPVTEEQLKEILYDF